MHDQRRLHRGVAENAGCPTEAHDDSGWMRGDFLRCRRCSPAQLRERKDLFLFLTATEGLDEAKRSLYLRLIDKGWTHNEINGNREHRGLVAGGNLNSIG